MQAKLSALLTAILIATTVSPALAGPHDKSGGQTQASSQSQSAPAPRADAHAQRAQQAPQAAPQRQFSAPQQRIERAAPQQRIERSAPQQRIERTAPQQRIERAVPQQRIERAAPQQRFERAAPQQRFERAAPQKRFERAAPQQRFERSAPQQRFERAAPQQRFERSTPQQRFERFGGRFEHANSRVEVNGQSFEQPVRIERNGIERGRTENVAPFEQVVQPNVTIRDEDVETTVPVVAYQPTIVTGEVVNVDNDDVFLQTPSGQIETIVVPGWHGHHHGWWRHVMAIPVVFTNGVYYAQPSAFVQTAPVSYLYPSYAYASSSVPMDIYQAVYPSSAYPAYNYSPYYGYSPYGNNGGNIMSNLLTATLASYVVSYLMGSHPSASSLISNVLPTLASAAISPGYNYGLPYAPTYVAPAYTSSYVTPTYTSYVAPAAYNPVTGYGYPTTCVYTDPMTGLTSYDPSCAPASTASYYASPNVYAPEQLQGVVVGTSGSSLMVLGANGLTPVLVNDAPALQNGYALNGQPSTGRVVTAYGFYSGNTFVATALE